MILDGIWDGLGAELFLRELGYFSWCPWRGLNASMQHALELAREHVDLEYIHTYSHYRHRLCERPGRRLMGSVKTFERLSTILIDMNWHNWRSLPGYFWPISGGFFPVRTFQSLTLQTLHGRLHQSQRNPFVLLACAPLILTCTIYCIIISLTYLGKSWHIYTYLMSLLSWYWSHTTSDVLRIVPSTGYLFDSLWQTLPRLELRAGLHLELLWVWQVVLLPEPRLRPRILTLASKNLRHAVHSVRFRIM